VLLGHKDVIHPRDLGLRTIKTISFTPWGDQSAAFALNSMGSVRSFRVMNGSIGSLEILDTSAAAALTGTGNYVRVRSLQVRPTGSINTTSGVGGAGGIYIGTVAGSMRASFTAVGR